MQGACQRIAVVLERPMTLTTRGFPPGLGWIAPDSIGPESIGSDSIGPDFIGPDFIPPAMQAAAQRGPRS